MPERSTGRTTAAKKAPAAPALLAAMGRAIAGGRAPSVSAIARRDRDPFRILISTLLSLRTKDDVTDAASERLFAIAPSARRLARLDLRRIEKAIYPVGFYRTKARTIRDIARRIDGEFDGRVPDTMEALLALKGVGRKTAALVVSLGFDTPAVCVDTHVHRIANRMGWVRTRTAHETELALMELLPRRVWIDVNETLVGYGQQVCTPVSPRCSTCTVAQWCARVGVRTSR